MIPPRIEKPRRKPGPVHAMRPQGKRFTCPTTLCGVDPHRPNVQVAGIRIFNALTNDAPVTCPQCLKAAAAAKVAP